MAKIKRCKVCDLEFVPLRRGTAFCSDACRALKQREDRRARKARYDESHPEQVKLISIRGGNVRQLRIQADPAFARAIAARARAYRMANAEALNARTKAWKARNPAAVRASKQRCKDRQARVKNNILLNSLILESTDR